MTSPLRREDLVNIVSTTLIVGFFVLVVYLPGERSCQAARRDIASANQTISDMPVRIQKAAERQQRIKAQEAGLRDRGGLLADENELHRVLQKVANLARAAGLQVERIQPQGAQTHATYRTIPYQLAASGSFRSLAQFLNGLESQANFFAVERCTLKGEDGQRGELLRADIMFSVYVKRESFAGSAEKSDGIDPAQADETKTRP